MSFHATDETIDKRVHASCAPLFASDVWARSGHSGQTINATTTFVKRGGCYYAVTCHHVLAGFRRNAVTSGAIIAPSVHIGRTVCQFGEWVDEKVYRWNFRSCRDFGDQNQFDDQEAAEELKRLNSEKPDIAIADISTAWEAIARARSLVPIDLDDWSEPTWAKLADVWAAYGFPTDHKSQRGEIVSAPMPRIAAKLESELPSIGRPEFKLYSTLKNKHGWSFSGVSGGPVIAQDTADELFHFVGIVYEGSPSSAALGASGESIFGPTDIFLYCYQITPATFDAWLGLSRYAVDLTRPSRVVW